MQDVLLRGCARHLIKVEGVAYHDYRPDVRFAIVKAMEENWDLFHCQAVDTFECRAMPDDPSKHRYQRDHPNLAEGSKMYCSEDVCYISAHDADDVFKCFRLENILQTHSGYMIEHDQIIR